MPFNSRQRTTPLNEIKAAILIQKFVRGLLGRKIFAKELLQRERGKRKSTKKNIMPNKQSEIAKLNQNLREEVVVVQAVKKQPIKKATASQSATSIIKISGALSASSMGYHTSSLLHYDGYDDDDFDPRASIDSLQQNHHDDTHSADTFSNTQHTSHSSAVPKNIMQLSGIQEIDEDVMRDSLNTTLRYQLPSTSSFSSSKGLDQIPNFSKTKRMADYEDLESDFGGVMDSLDMARVTERSSVAGTVPWPHHHGRSKTVMPSASANSTSISEQFASVRQLEYDIHGIEDEEKLEDSLEYQIMMKDILSTPRLQTEHGAKAGQLSPTGKNVNLTPLPLSQPPPLKPNNHIALFSPNKPIVSSSSQGESKASIASVTPSVDAKKQVLPSQHHTNYVEEKIDVFSSPRNKNTMANNIVENNSGKKPVGAVVSAPQAAAAAGSKIPLSHSNRNQNVYTSKNTNNTTNTINSININIHNSKQPVKTQVIAAINDGNNYDDAIYYTFIPNNYSNHENTIGNTNNTENNDLKVVRKGPPTIKDLLSVMPAEEKASSQHNSSNHKLSYEEEEKEEEKRENKLALLQKMYFEDVASTLNNNNNNLNHGESKINAVNLVMVGSPSKKAHNSESTYSNNDINNSYNKNIIKQQKEEEEGDDLVNLRVQYQKKQQQQQQKQPPKVTCPTEDDNVSVLTDASPFPLNNNNNRNVRVTSASKRLHNNINSNNNDSNISNKRAERRISFSENVQRQSPRMAQNYPDEQGSVFSSGTNNNNNNNKNYISEHAKLVAAASNLRPPRHNNRTDNNVNSNMTNNTVNNNNNNNSNNRKNEAVSSVYHQKQYGRGGVQGGVQLTNNYRNFKPSPPTNNNNNNSNSAMKSQELEKQLLEEIAVLNRKQLLLKEAQITLQQQPPSPNTRLDNNNNVNRNNNSNINKKNNDNIIPRENISERKAVSAPKSRPTITKEKESVDPVKEKEKKAFGWGARDYKPPSNIVKKEHQQMNNNIKNNVVSPREIVQQWKAAALNDSAHLPANLPNNNNSNHNLPNNNNNTKINQPVYEQPNSLKQDHSSLAHMHLDASPGYLQDFHRRKQQQQQQRSVSAQRGGAARGRVIALDNGDERSYHSANTHNSNNTIATNNNINNSARNKSSVNSHRLETVSLPPLLPYQQHHNLAVAPTSQQEAQAGYVHPFMPPNRRVAPPSSRHSTRSAPS